MIENAERETALKLELVTTLSYHLSVSSCVRFKCRRNCYLKYARKTDLEYSICIQ